MTSIETLTGVLTCASTTVIGVVIHRHWIPKIKEKRRQIANLHTCGSHRNHTEHWYYDFGSITASNEMWCPGYKMLPGHVLVRIVSPPKALAQPHKRTPIVAVVSLPQQRKRQKRREMKPRNHVDYHGRGTCEQCETGTMHFESKECSHEL